MKRAIKQSQTKVELYNNISECILFVIIKGFDYNEVMKWNVCVFWEILGALSKYHKAKYGIKND